MTQEPAQEPSKVTASATQRLGEYIVILIMTVLAALAILGATVIWGWISDPPKPSEYLLFSHGTNLELRLWRTTIETLRENRILIILTWLVNIAISAVGVAAIRANCTAKFGDDYILLMFLAVLIGLGLTASLITAEIVLRHSNTRIPISLGSLFALGSVGVVLGWTLTTIGRTGPSLRFFRVIALTFVIGVTWLSRLENLYQLGAFAYGAFLAALAGFAKELLQDINRTGASNSKPQD